MTNMNHEVKSYDTLDFTDDFLFCKILTTDLELTRELLEIILNTRIRKVKIAESQKGMKLTPYGRGVRLDVYVQDDENVVYDVEMQTTEEKELGKRARYYQGMIDLNLIENGQDFSELGNSFVIFILKHQPKGLAANLPVYTFRYRAEEDSGVVLRDGAVKVLVNAEGPTEGLPERLKNFLEFIRDRKPKDTFTERLDDHVQKARESRDWRLEYMTLEMKLREQYKLGREEGRKEGRSAGVLEMQKKSANAALDLGIPYATIITEFGIPESVLNAVLEERKNNKA